jgi:large subunit ribosomal protein L32
MPVPKRKRSRARRDSRFANKGIQVKAFALCKNCQSPVMPHQVCKDCGYYKGKKVIATKAERSVKRNEIKQAAQARVQEQKASAPQE